MFAAPPPRPDSSQTFTVTTLANSGAGSLRAAITAADASGPSPADITFAVRGIIALETALPPITRDVTIDGTTAPGYAAGGPPTVEIQCGGNSGLDFAPGSAHAQLLGLAVDDARGNGVTLNAGNITVNDDYIGLNLAGRADGNRGNGLVVAAGSKADAIGLNPSGDSGAVGNVISANGGSGLVLSGASDVTAAANRIGTNPAGTAAVPNRGDGILVTDGASDNELGGTVFTDARTGLTNNPTGSKGKVPPVFVVPPLGNLVSGNDGDGVAIVDRSRRTILNGNFIGTTADGDAALGNHGNGVSVDDATGTALVGCKFVNQPFVYYNVLSGNKGNGLLVTNADRTTVQANFFGVGANNTAILGNGLNGIEVTGNSKSTQVGGVIPLGNVSAGNKLNGIDLAGTASYFTTFNTFGGLLAFKGAAPNGRDGLLITATGGHNLVRTNVFSGNAGNGIELAGNASGVTVDPNIVGLVTKGNAVLPNRGDGLLIDGTAHRNTIGGDLRSVIPQNTFSGNDGYGLVITGAAYANRVFSTDLGTDVLGTAALANHRGGVLISGRAHANSIGDSIGAARPPVNLISGNAGPGVRLTTNTSDNRVINNYIGLSRTGKPLPNTGKPVVNNGHHNVVQGNHSKDQTL
ncbi:MAG TPA: right-handed parallel beta-helix repeat-containing protein [Trebonia sp.]|jgi:hypothetical protein|nr:right-handed parallel beta-helix repeat-containing protein [Trebonia sp.]